VIVTDSSSTSAATDSTTSSTLATTLPTTGAATAPMLGIGSALLAIGGLLAIIKRRGSHA